MSLFCPACDAGAANFATEELQELFVTLQAECGCKKLRSFPDSERPAPPIFTDEVNHWEGSLGHQQANSESLIGNDISSELSAQRTAMSFDRTALSSDRTLMAGVRTSLALIGFGFTIFQFFHTLNAKFLEGALPAEAPRRFGLTLIILGVILLVVGILNHRSETKLRRQRRQNLFDRNLIHSCEMVQLNSAMVVAILLLLAGLAAILRVGLSMGPF